MWNIQRTLKQSEYETIFTDYQYINDTLNDICTVYR